MKKWERPEVLGLGVENTKTDEYANDNPFWCTCNDNGNNVNQGGSHNHGKHDKFEEGHNNYCPCCRTNGFKPIGPSTKPDISLS